MAYAETILEGTVLPDGLLVLDEHMPLPVGRVTVVVRPHETPEQAKRTWWEILQEGRLLLEQSGKSFLTDDDMNQYIAWLNESDHFDELLKRKMN
jgi:hypothetical protein